MKTTFDDIPDPKQALRAGRYNATIGALNIVSFAALTGATLGIASPITITNLVGGATSAAVSYHQYQLADTLKEGKQAYIETYGREAYKQNIAEQRQKNDILASIASDISSVFAEQGKTYSFFSSNDQQLQQGTLNSIIRATTIAASNNEEIDILAYNDPAKRHRLVAEILEKTQPAVERFFIAGEIAHNVKNHFRDEGLLASGNTLKGKRQRNFIQLLLVPEILEAGHFDLLQLRNEGKIGTFSKAVTDTVITDGVREHLANNKPIEHLGGGWQFALRLKETEWGKYSKDPDPRSTAKMRENDIAGVVKGVLRDQGALNSGHLPSGKKQRLTIQKLIVPALLKAGNFDVTHIAEQGKIWKFSQAIAAVLATDAGKSLINRERKTTSNEVGALLASLPQEWDQYKQEKPLKRYEGTPPSAHVSHVADNGSLKTPLLQRST